MSKSLTQSPRQPGARQLEHVQSNEANGSGSKRIRVISWNILADFGDPKYSSQEERLAGIVSTLKKYITKQPTFVFLFEANNPLVFEGVAKRLNYEHWQSIKYASPSLHMGYISNVPIKKYETIHHSPGLLGNKNESSLKVYYNEVAIDAVHMPHNPMLHVFTRLGFVVNILESEKRYKKRIIVGDLNALILMPSRLLLWIAGFRYVFATSAKKDKFPSPYYRGKSVPKFFPKINIDAHYKKGQITVFHHYRQNTKYSDHPILVTDFMI